MLIIVRSLEKLGYEGNIVRPFLTQRFKEYSKCAMVLIQLYIKKATNSKYIDNIMITRFLCIYLVKENLWHYILKNFHP